MTDRTYDEIAEDIVRTKVKFKLFGFGGMSESQIQEEIPYQIKNLINRWGPDGPRQTQSVY